MKRLYYIFLLAVIALADSCAPRFEEEFSSLKLDYTEMSVSATAEKTLVTIYYSGSWKASLPEGLEWAQLEKSSGTGKTDNRILFKQNKGPQRKTVLTITADNGDVIQLNVIQKGNSGAFLQFAAADIHLPADGLTVQIPFDTNMGEDYVLRMFEGFVPEGTPAGVSYEMSEPQVLEDGAERRMLSLTLPANGTGEDRTLELPAQITSDDGKTYGEVLRIVQDSENAYLNAADKMVVNRYEAEYSFTVSHNLGYLASGITNEVTYPDGDSDFVDASYADGVMTFTVSESDQERTASFLFAYSGYGLDLSCTTELMQVVDLIPRKISADDLAGLFTGASQLYTPTDIYTDYVEVYVIGGAGNPNMEQNINTGPNAITTEENDRTAYVQDAASDPSRGFRVKFTSSDENALCHGDLVKLSLAGCTLKKESNPERYTIEGLTASNIEVISSGNEITPESRTVASLSAGDVYTYCSLQNMEFQVKEGAFTNVREECAIPNPFAESKELYAMDGAANLMYDDSGDAIYALVNMGCDWRRDKVPADAVSVAGVIVHQDMPRWGGNVGVYSIRPLDVEDIDMAGNTSAWSVLAEWVLTENSTETTAYIWKHGPDNADGYATNGASSSDLVQNKMLATNGAQAMIYSENLDGRTTKSGFHQKAATPVSLGYGYRGLDMGSSNPGMSVGSTMTFWGNPAGWYQWNSTTITGYNGIVMEFSTENITGSSAAVGFSIAAGYMNGITVAAQSMTSFPVYWTVEYSVDGNSWTEVTNKATGNIGFEMRGVPGIFDGNTSKAPHYGTKTAIPILTQSDTGFGYVPYRFNLPAEVFGHENVKVRIRPSSDIIMCFNSDWDAGIASAGLHAMAQSDQVTNVNHGVFLEDVVIQYK